MRKKPIREGAAERRIALQRDGWRCRCCGSSRWLTTHHIQYRSLGGSDDPSNLVTLCRGCHAAIHEKRLTITPKDGTTADANQGLFFIPQNIG